MINLGGGDILSISISLLLGAGSVSKDIDSLYKSKLISCCCILCTYTKRRLDVYDLVSLVIYMLNIYIYNVYHGIHLIFNTFIM